MKIEKLMWASTDQLRQEMVSKINEIIDKVNDKVNEPVEMNSPLKRTDALDEKKEEPKSTLREEIKYLVTHTGPTTQDSLLRVTDQIISLFKDTLLKEVKKAEPLRIPGESLEFTSGQEWTMRQIKQIIKNL